VLAPSQKPTKQEGDDYVGVVQAVRGLSGHDEAIPGQALRVGVVARGKNQNME